MIINKLNKEAIQAHNELRALHGCPEISYDSKLASDSQKWAEHLASINCLQHSKGDDYGENLAFQMSTAGASLNGHFTQVIWKSTIKAGFGSALSKDGKKVYVVGRYKPAGNIIDLYEDNVPKPKITAPPRDEFIKIPESKCSIL
ncbi:venom allergen-like (VAL) 16 protein [Schistosoma mansoni]|uniref:venom allergen-like (VAL) 16 protein n=1 Tax=Schistosoma mansoni TaxID=6183 RepID=UPI00022DC963|nr:venom allergen-like (VAL) 16 protein [Schistosoma mansoni]|eukprot:XP_018647667.1 venom allergen-like (VAL) 16 protein [Schistosoma mansoni]